MPMASSTALSREGILNRTAHREHGRKKKDSLLPTKMSWYGSHSSGTRSLTMRARTRDATMYRQVRLKASSCTPDRASTLRPMRLLQTISPALERQCRSARQELHSERMQEQKALDGSFAMRQNAMQSIFSISSNLLIPTVRRRSEREDLAHQARFRQAQRMP